MKKLIFYIQQVSLENSMKVFLLILTVLFSFLVGLNSQAEEEKVCIDGNNFRQIKCEQFTNLEKVTTGDPKLLEEIEKMYPKPPKEKEEVKNE